METIEQGVFRARPDYDIPGYKPLSKPVTGKEGFFKRVMKDIKQRGESIGKTVEERKSGNISRLETNVRNVGDVIGGVGDVIGEAAVSTFRALPDRKEEQVREFGRNILSTSVGQAGVAAIGKGVEAYTDWKQKNPRAAESLEGVVNISSVLPMGKGAQLAGKGVVNAGELGVKSSKAVANKVSENIFLNASKQIGKGVGEAVTNIPRRIVANVEENASKQAVIKTLPNKTTRIAARDGVDPLDIKFIQKIPSSEKKIFKKLFAISEKYAVDKSSANPIQAIGKSITKRIKDLDGVRDSVGTKLGAVANKLGNVSSSEIIEPVFLKLKKVPGLSDIKLTKSNNLDFSDTSLASVLSKSDRSAIQKAFKASIKEGTGKQKHLLRQELFEILGGKKRSLQQLTATQEKAFDAIRDGLSEVLEGKNKLYKKLSNDYRQAVQPLQEMRKFMKNVIGADGDILDMKAGLLARRLTSNVASNPEIKNILNMMDNVLKLQNKKVPVSTERLQDFYNILDKYYDLAGATTFQGQVQRGLEKAGGVQEAVVEIARSFAGKTDAVTQKALKRVIEEFLK